MLVSCWTGSPRPSMLHVHTHTHHERINVSPGKPWAGPIRGGGELPRVAPKR